MSRCHVHLRRAQPVGHEIEYVVSDLDNVLEGCVAELAHVRLSPDRKDAAIFPCGLWEGSPVVASAMEAIDALWGDGGNRERLDRVAPYGGRLLVDLLGEISRMIRHSDFPDESPKLSKR